MSHPTYRPDIDGLRAVAVLGVLWYHLGLPGIPGGFTGVDIFFVISGYLITTILYKDIGSGTYTTLGFYERRARRIMPALTAVLLASFVAACFILMPSDLQKFGATMAATGLFAANMQLMVTSSYFGGESAFKPLLHMWSLGVEEQFYIVFPLVLVAVKALGFWKRLSWLLIAGFGVSLAACVVLTPLFPTGAFYALPTRAFELLAGSMLAVGMIPSPQAAWQRNAMAVAGAALLAGSYLFIREDMAFPGWLALIPCVGAVFTIAAHGKGSSIVKPILASKPMVGVGLVSYSLYLWHWPVIVFGTFLLGAKPTPEIAAVMGALSIGLAYLSWRFVEQPWRHSARTSRKAVWMMTALGIALAVCLGAAAYVMKGFPQRLPEHVQTIAAMEKDFSSRRKACHGYSDSTQPIAQSCVYGAEGVSPTTMVWSDSHGVELVYAMGEVLAGQGAAVIGTSSSACPPALGYASVHRPKCAAHNAKVLKYIEENPTISKVVLVMYHHHYINGPEAALYKAGLEETIRTLGTMNRHVMLATPFPVFDVPVPARAGLAAWYGWPAPVLEAEAFSRENAPIHAFVESLAATYPHVSILRSEHVLCPTGACAGMVNGAAWYYDRNHPSLTAARAMAGRWFGLD